MTRLLAFFLLLCASSFANYCCDHVLIEGKLAYFRPNDSTIRDIYGSAWLNSQAEITTRVWGDCHNLSLYGSVNYLCNTGKSIDEACKTKIKILPVTAGLKYRACVKQTGRRLDLYAAGGPRYFFLWIDNKDPFVTRKVDKNGLGWVVEGGALFFLTQCLCVDLFLDYSSKTFLLSGSNPLVQGHKVNVGGFSAGAGLGFQF